MKPLPIVTVAPTRVPPLSISVTLMPESSVTGVPPPVNVTVPPAVTAGATCTRSSVVVPVLLAATPSFSDQSMTVLVRLAPCVGSSFAGLVL
jgi:hypothetical protein